MFDALLVFSNVLYLAWCAHYELLPCCTDNLLIRYLFRHNRTQLTGSPHTGIILRVNSRDGPALESRIPPNFHVRTQGPAPKGHDMTFEDNPLKLNRRSGSRERTN